jgi:hypothetical protein
MPTGASSNIPIGGKPDCFINPLMTTFVEVLISVTELERIDANAIGINSREALIFVCWLKPKSTGKKNAAEAVLLMKAPNIVTTIMVAGSRLAGRLLVN